MSIMCVIRHVKQLAYKNMMKISYNFPLWKNSWFWRRRNWRKVVRCWWWCQKLFRRVLWSTHAKNRFSPLKQQHNNNTHKNMGKWLVAWVWVPIFSDTSFYNSLLSSTITTTRRRAIVWVQVTLQLWNE